MHQKFELDLTEAQTIVAAVLEKAVKNGHDVLVRGAVGQNG